MKKSVRAAIVSMVVLMLLCTIVSVQAQTPDNGQGNANVIAQNMDPSVVAVVRADYYDPDGSLADTIQKNIKPLAAKEFQISATTIGEPWIGSMILSSSRELASVVNLLWDGGTFGDGSTAASYAGRTQTSDVWHLPWVVIEPGRQGGQISIQNADTTSVVVDIRYYLRGEPALTAEVSQSIAVGGSVHYDLGDPGGKVPDLPGLIGEDRWPGSVVVTARGGKQITVSYVNQLKGWSGAYMGVTLCSQTVIAPMVRRRAVDGSGDLWWQESATVVLQNPNDKGVWVDVDFHSGRTGSLAKSFEDIVIGPHKGLVFNLATGGRGIPAAELEVLDYLPGPDVDWYGMVVVHSSRSDRPICGVVHSGRRTAIARTYEMIGTAEGSPGLYMPTAYRMRPGGSWSLSSRLAVANVSDHAAIVSFDFYDRAGNLDLSLKKHVLKNGVKVINMRSPVVSSLGYDWVGSVYVSAKYPIAATVDTYWTNPIREGAYNAIHD